MRTAAALSTARQAAIQKGEPVLFAVTADSVTVKLKSTADTSDILSPIPLYTLYKVRAETTPTSLTLEFNSRGFVASGVRKVIRLTRSGVPDDSVVILPTGMVKR